MDNRILIAAALHGIPYSFITGKPIVRKEPRPCLNCGKLKAHNNSFCSPTCCKEYKNAKH